MKKIVISLFIFILISMTLFSQITYRYDGSGEYYLNGKVLKNGDTIKVNSFIYNKNFNVIQESSDFPEVILGVSEIDINTNPQIEQEFITGVFNGTNKEFGLLGNPVLQNSVEFTLIQYTQVQDEDLTGTINGQNQTFTTQNSAILPGSIDIVFDSLIDTIADDGNGNLFGYSTGTVNYTSGQIVLATQPSTSLVQDYTYITETTITDDQSGVLSDGGSIDFDTGIFELSSQPQTSSLLVQDYTKNTKQSVQEFQIYKVQDVKLEIEIDQSNVQDLKLYFNTIDSYPIQLECDYEQVVNSENVYRFLISNSNQNAKYKVTLKDNDLIKDYSFQQ